MALTRDVAGADDENLNALVEQARELHRKATALQDATPAPV
ncbi:hypothetical protein FHS23_004424 [Prauserella isguenensis]|uniref:Uncharacterized protein n=1 Tax=Prauserella isguenensis TaxID=1470180 RepID=A0A839S687_9PSEU|nr:hypothetical protein [Prauserella isguenensis]MBB3053375.1 hypothetical protein [Prauserella isguenensis]